MTEPTNEEPTRGGLSKASAAFLFLTILALAGSFLWRFAVDHEKVSTPSGMAGFSSQAPKSGESGAAAASYVTAASVCGLLGFAAGFTVRKFLMACLLILGAVVILVIALSWFKVIALDWPTITHWLDATIQGMSKKLGTLEALKLHLPSSATFTTGVVMGVRFKGGVA